RHWRLGSITALVAKLDCKTSIPIHIVDARQQILGISLVRHQISVRRNGSVTDRPDGAALLDETTRSAYLSPSANSTKAGMLNAPGWPPLVPMPTPTANVMVPTWARFFSIATTMLL